MASCTATIRIADPHALAHTSPDAIALLTADQFPLLEVSCSLEPHHGGRHQAYFATGLFDWPDLELQHLSLT